MSEHEQQNQEPNADQQVEAGGDVAEQAADGTGPEKTETPTERTYTTAELEEIVKQRLERAKQQADKAAAKAAEDAQRKAAEEQGKYKELYEQMQAQVQEAERRAAELEQAALRREAADKTGLPAALAERLRGETLDEMLDDAKALLAAMPKKEAAAANINGTARGTTKQAPSDDEIRQQAAQLGVSFEFMKQQYGG